MTLEKHHYVSCQKQKDSAPYSAGQIIAYLTGSQNELGAPRIFTLLKLLKTSLRNKDYFLAKDSLAEFQNSGEATIDMEDIDWGVTSVSDVSQRKNICTPESVFIPVRWGSIVVRGLALDLSRPGR